MVPVVLAFDDHKLWRLSLQNVCEVLTAVCHWYEQGRHPWAVNSLCLQLDYIHGHARRHGNSCDTCVAFY
jgi:hypothetical protein